MSKKKRLVSEYWYSWIDREFLLELQLHSKTKENKNKKKRAKILCLFVVDLGKVGEFQESKNIPNHYRSSPNNLQKVMENSKFIHSIQERTFWEIHHPVTFRIRNRTFSLGYSSIYCRHRHITMDASWGILWVKGRVENIPLDTEFLDLSASHRMQVIRISSWRIFLGTWRGRRYVSNLFSCSFYIWLNWWNLYQGHR